jgi:hypothetical protein
MKKVKYKNLFISYSKLILLIFTLFIAGFIIDQTNPIFENGSDIGNVKNKGSFTFDKHTGNYILKGSGKNMWFNNDEFYFVWKKVKGDFTLNTTINWVGTGVEPHRKAGLIIRQSLDPDSKYISIANHGEGLMAMQYRTDKDSLTKEIRTDLKALSNLQMQKVGDKIITRGAKNGETLAEIGTLNMKFDTSGYYIGLFICSHNPDIIEEAVFSQTHLLLQNRK